MTLNLAAKSLLSDVVFETPATDRFGVHNPATGDVLGYVQNQGADECERAINAAQNALKSWSGLTAKARSIVLRKWNDLIIAHVETLAMIVTLEQGRPIKETRGEVLYGASFVEWFAEEGKRAYGRTIPATLPNKHLETIKLPIGVCCAITPWNFPISMITRKVAPALAAGCCVVIKPSEETPFSALTLGHLAKLAGIPDGVMSIITTTDAKSVGEVMTSDTRVKKLSFTGSTQVGKYLYEKCASTVKKISLELGGNAPFIVFDDADLGLAIEGVMASKFRNSGQTCVCANRIMVQSGIYDRFISAFKERVSAMIMANGVDERSQIGPLINEKAVQKIESLVKDAVSKGAKIEVGGKVDDLGDLFYQPSILSGITQNMDIFSSEIFGPVAAIVKFESEAQAVSMANDTPFGLAAYAFTCDIGRGMRLTRVLDYGMVGINDGMISTEATPFGGIKESGIGREGAAEGLEEYLITKYISFGGLGLDQN